MQEYSKSLDNCDCTPSEHKFVERITDYKILFLIFYVLFIIIYIYYEWLSFAYLLFNSIEELELKSKQNIRRIFAPMGAIMPFIGVYVLTPIIYIYTPFWGFGCLPNPTEWRTFLSFIEYYTLS